MLKLKQYLELNADPNEVSAEEFSLIVDYNNALCADYPFIVPMFLLGDDEKPFTVLDDMTSSWRVDNQEIFLNSIKNALGNDEFQILYMSDRDGVFECETVGGNEQVDEVLDYYRNIELVGDDEELNEEVEKVSATTTEEGTVYLEEHECELFRDAADLLQQIDEATGKYELTSKYPSKSLHNLVVTLGQFAEDETISVGKLK